MAKSILGVIVALLISVSFASTSVHANECLPLADKEINPDPSVLADRIEESLASDPSGSGPIRGANIGPWDYLRAVNAVPRFMNPSAEVTSTVKTVGDLPAYLRTLKSGPMPKGKVSLAGVCEGKLTLRTHEGSGREAHLGEVGWYDQRGDLILAGDCMNTPIMMEITVNRGLPMKSMPEAQAWTDPYAGKRKVEGTATVCKIGERGRYVSVQMLEPKAAEHPCSIKYMLPQDGKLEEERVCSIYPDGTEECVEKKVSDWAKKHSQYVFDANDIFSRMCGPILHDRKPGAVPLYQLGAKHHEVKLAIIDGEKRRDFFEGTLKGKTFTADGESEKLISKDGEAVFVPVDFRSGTVVAFFADQAKVRTPSPSGVGEDLRTFKDGCAVKVLTGIDMP